MTTAFKVGDKVPVHNHAHNGTKGTVTRLRSPQSWPFEVTYANGTNGPFAADELKLVEEKPTFKTGDMVRYDSKGICPEFDGLELKISSREWGSATGTYAWITKGNHHFPEGKEVSVTTAYLSLIEEKVTHGGIKIGDKVRFKGTTNVWGGSEGIVEELNIGSISGAQLVNYRVTKIGGMVGYSFNTPLQVGKLVTQVHGGKGVGFDKLEVIPEEKPFLYKEIQVGDKIRRVFSFEDGATITKEGVVVHKGTDVARGAVIALAFRGDDAQEAVTLELLERPEPVKAPEPTKPWDNAKTGDVLFRTYKDGQRDTFVKGADGGWTIFYPAGGTFDVGPDEKLSGYFIGHECIAPQLA